MSCIPPQYVKSAVRLFLLLVISSVFPGYLSAQTADQYVQAGRWYLTQQTSQGLQDANTAFSTALARDPKNLQALFLEPVTRLALLIQQPAFSTLLSRVGVTQVNQNAYGFDLQFPVNERGFAQAAPNAQSSDILDYTAAVLRPALLDALAKLQRIPAPRAGARPTDYLKLGWQETSVSPTAIDYGDVEALKAVLHLLLSASCGMDTVNLRIAIQDLLDLSDGVTTMQDVLKKYPSFIASVSDVSKRADARKHLAAGLLALGNAYSYALNPLRSYPSPSTGYYSHLVMINYASPGERTIAKESLAQIRALAASLTAPTKIPASRYNPNPLLDNQTLFLGALFNPGISPRAWLGPNSFYGEQLVLGSLNDPTLSGLYKPSGVASLMTLLDQSGYLISPVSQTITFTPPPTSVPYSRNGTITLSATGGASGQPVVFSSRSKNVSISGNTMTLLGVGPVVITATQAGYAPPWQVGPAPYAAAQPVIRSMVVTKGTPQITLDVPSTVAYSKGLIVRVSASSTSDKAVAVVSSNPKVAVYQRNGTLLIKAPGTAVIRATVPASGNFNPASTTKTLTVSSAQ